MRASPFVLGGHDKGTGLVDAPAGTAAAAPAASPSDPLPPQARDVWLDAGEPPAGDAQAAAEGRQMHRGYRNRHGVDVHVGDDVMVLRDDAGSAAGLSAEASLAHFRCVRLWALHEDASGRRRADVFRWLRVGDDATSGYFARCPDAASHPKELFPLLPDEDADGLETVDVSLIHHRILVRAVAQDTMAMEDRPPYQDPAPKHKIVAGRTGLQGARPSAEGFLCCWPCFLSRPDQFLTYRDWDVDGDEPGMPLDEAHEVPFNGLLAATCDAAKRGGLRSGDTGFASIAAHDAAGADMGWGGGSAGGGGGGGGSSDGAAGGVAPVVPAAPTVSVQPSAGGAAVAPLAAAAGDDTASEVIHALCLSEEASDVPPPPQPPQPKAAEAEAEAAEAAQPYNEVLSEGALRELAADVLARGVEAESEVLACLAPILGVPMPEPQPSSPPPPPPAAQQTASSSQHSASPPQSQERTPTPTPTPTPPPPGGADRVRVPLPRLDPGALKRGCSAAAVEHRRLLAALNAEVAACCGVPEAKRLRQ